MSSKYFMHINILKTFGRCDGILKSTAIVSNLSTIASVSILAGFGKDGLAIANTIQLTTSGIIEVPSGLLADRFGKKNSTLIALGLKVFVTLSFLISVFFSQINKPELAWSFFLVEAVVDAIASSLLSGSYQASAHNWYQNKLHSEGVSNNGSSKLFLDSFQHAKHFRLGLPWAFVAYLCIGKYFEQTHAVSGYFLAYMALFAVLVMRVFVFISFVSLFKNNKENLSLERPTYLTFKIFRDFLWKQTFTSHFFTYLIASSITFVSLLYLGGAIFKLVPMTNLSPTFSWITGVSIGLIIYTVKTLMGIYFYPRITRNDYNFTLSSLAYYAGFTLFFLAVTDLVVSDTSFRFFTTVILALISSFFADFLQRYIESDLHKYSRAEFRATWLSLGNCGAMITVAFFSALLLSLSIADKMGAISISILSIALILAAIRMRFTESQSLPSLKSIQEVTKHKIRFNLVTLLFTLFISDALINIYLVVTETNSRESSSISVINSSLLEPLSQGNFPESVRMLHASMSTQGLVCTRIKVWSLTDDTCSSANKKPLFNIDLNSKIEIPGSNETAELNFIFDRKPQLIRLVLKILASGLILYILGVFIGLTIDSIFRGITSDLGRTLAFLDSSKKLVSANGPKGAFLETQEISLRVQGIINDHVALGQSVALVDLSKQVAHDIRSPLAALSALEPQMHMLPENTRILVRSAISRIQDIANNLLAHNQAQKTGITIQEPITTQLITAIIDPLISEKRLQLRAKPHTQLIWNMGAESYGLFAAVQSIEFKRILSNLINNAADALPNHFGRIVVTATTQGSNLEIAVKDNGSGISKELLQKLGTRGETHGKDGGSGLGLAHAKEFAHKWGGTLTLDSIQALGTTVTLILPLACAPAWFVTKLTLKPKSKIYLLDDDYSIHRIWKGRLESSVGHDSGIILETFSQASDFEAAVKSDPPDLCLLDFELAGQEVTGLDIVEKLGIGDHSILVSSRFEEPQVHQRAVALKMKILPKGMTGLVPFEFLDHSHPKLDAVLIDDDSLVHLTWEYSAKSKNKTIVCFSSPEDFMASAPSISKNTPIYLDANLGHGVKGDEFAQKLAQQGFTHLYLATGYSAQNYGHLDFLKGVVGKDPPWAV